MRITAITRYKHGELLAILRRLGWSQAELARRSGISVQMIGCYINLVRRPGEEQANRIQRALGEAGEYLDVEACWPETFEGLGRVIVREQTEDVPVSMLLDYSAPTETLALEDIKSRERMEVLESVLVQLDKQQQAAIRLNILEGLSLDETGKKLGVSRERIRQIVSKGLRLMRHPRRMRMIADAEGMEIPEGDKPLYYDVSIPD